MGFVGEIEGFLNNRELLVVCTALTRIACKNVPGFIDEFKILVCEFCIFHTLLLKQCRFCLGRPVDTAILRKQAPEFVLGDYSDAKFLTFLYFFRAGLASGQQE